MKKFIYFLIISFNTMSYANVKVFINNSQKHFLVRIYSDSNEEIGVLLAPGAVQDVFIPGNALHKIIIQDDINKSKTLSSSMTRQELRSKSYPINDHMIFIIHHNGSVKMYKAATTRDACLQNIDAAYHKNAQLPTIDLAIHTTKSNELWSMQNISYSLKSDNSFLESIESLFQ